MITKNAANTPWIRCEIDFFFNEPERRNKILLLRFDDTPAEAIDDIFLAFRPRFADFRNTYDVGFAAVLSALGAPARLEESTERGDSDRLRFAIDLSIRAGNVAMRFYNASIDRNRTLDNRKSSATEADYAAQAEVLARIERDANFGDDWIIAEQEPYNNETHIRNPGYTWVVDPLDGTVNFENGIPLFCTAVGCLRDGVPHIGVVYDPVENEVYFAVRGTQTRMWNISKGEVRNVFTDQKILDLKKSVLGIHISSRPEVAEKFVESGILMDLSREVRHLRALGCGQLALAYVATGRLHGFVQFSTYIWDQVAGIVLVRCAGGSASNPLTAEEWKSSSKNVLAVANGHLRNAMGVLWRNHPLPDDSTGLDE